jgi:hypothetical protein
MQPLLSDEIIGVRFSLRSRLQHPANHQYRAADDTTIPSGNLTAEMEPALHAIIKQIAAEIVANPAIILEETYTVDQRKKDWLRLVKEDFLDDAGEIGPIGSRARVGHYVIDKYMTHFHEVQNHAGRSMLNSITQESIEKALHMNVKGHSTPYASEIRKMITMGKALGSVTKYRAKVAKTIVKYFGAERVLDPCAGWGGRMLGAAAAGAAYVGCDPDPRTAAGLRAILADPSIPADIGPKVTILEKPCEQALAEGDITGPFDLILTSPPYFNLELYTGGEQSTAAYPTWEGWVSDWLKPVIVGSLALLNADGVSCWSVKDFKTDRPYKLVDAVTKIHKEAGYELVKTVKMTGVGRMGVGRINDQGEVTRKSEEDTYCFQRS